MNIQLQNKQIHIIHFRRGMVNLDHTNPKAMLCKDCETPLEMGAGVYRRALLGNGFICFNCLRANLLACSFDLGYPDHDTGFHFDHQEEHALVQYCGGEGVRLFSTFEVLEAVRREWKYDILDALQGLDFITPQRLEDAIDSYKARA